MATWKLIIEYDGSKYSGWQEQNNARTVQGELRKAAEEFLKCDAEIQGSGRTDAGVHALAQVAHLRSRVKTPPHPDLLRRSLNDALPSDIAILEAERVPDAFHARHDAVSRTYVYQISTRKTAFSKKHVWWVKDKLDVAAMARAADTLVGRHDFICFRAEDPSKPNDSTVVVVESASVELDEDLIQFRIEASHFLWRMVRRLVGALVKLGKGEIAESDFAKLLAGKCDHKLNVASWTAPSAGLFLESVRY